MPKGLPFLCAALLALAACNQHGADNDGDRGNPAPTPATSTPATRAIAATAASAATTSAAVPTAAQSKDASVAGASPPPTPATTTTATATAAAAGHDPWIEGKNYFVIEPSQPKVTNTDKVEVVEVFSYGCPACNLFHPIVDKLVKNLPDNAVMVYLPVSFNPAENFPMFQRAYYAAETLGVAGKAHDAIFDAVWKSAELSSEKAGGGLKPTSALPTIEDAAKVYATFGADPKEFVAIANSFAINTKMKRADELVQSYGVEQTPTLVIDGKYRFTTGSAGGYPQTVELTKWLVAKEAAGK